MGLLIGIGLAGFALFGGALFVLLGGASIIGYATAGEPISTILIDFNRLTRNSTILIIPLFTFAGYIIAEGKAPQRLVRVRARERWLATGRYCCGCALYLRIFYHFHRGIRHNDYRPRWIALSNPAADI